MLNYVEEKHLEPLFALADVIIGEVDPESIKDQLPPEFPMDRLEEYCKLTPSKIPLFRRDVVTSLRHAGVKSNRLLIVVSLLLSSRITAPTLTGSLTLITDMTYEQKVALLHYWRDSPVPALRKLFRSFTIVTMKLFNTNAGELHNIAMGYPARDLRTSLYEGQKIDDFRYPMFPRVQKDKTELHLPQFDALVIGSGSGAGVVVHTLAEQGFKSLVLEKGKYYTPQEYVFDDDEGLRNLYEKGGSFANDTQDLFILAGSTFGGGSTVNWSACIPTPFKVRKEWYDDYGVKFAATDEYDKCLDYVWKKMGATIPEPTHSRSNQAILDSTERLGYHSAEVAQNNGNHPNHDCGMCHLGCKYGIKQGSQQNWFRDASQKGSEFLDQVRVERILHKGGKAYGVECYDEVTKCHFTITGPKKFIVSGGSLNTPVVLQNSGFKNKNIGKNLKLHPCMCVLGNYGKDVNINAYERPILSAVSNQVADLDSKAHGPKIETYLHSPFIESAFLPWENAVQARRDIINFNHTALMLIIQRDHASGRVYTDSREPGKPLVQYHITKNDLNDMLQGILVASDMLYVDGVEEIFISQAWTPRFISKKPKHERAITDKDFVSWRKKVEKIGLSLYGIGIGSAHQMSSCRMSGKGPKYGAVDLKGKLFECSNVYVADASVLPTASGANPMISTMTMARHISLDIAKDLQATLKL